MRGYDETNGYRRDCLKIAKDFCYGQKVIQQLYMAKTAREISNIMTRARKEKFGES